MFFKKLKDEIIAAIPAIIYFTFAFNLIFYTTGLTLAPDTLRHFNTWTVTVFGLLMGKILIIANALPFLDAFPTKPLIYNITWKFFIYILLIFILWAIENCLHVYYLYRNSDACWVALNLDLHSPVFWSGLLWLCATFLIYLIFSEFERKIGKKTIRKMLLG